MLLETFKVFSIFRHSLKCLIYINNGSLQGCMKGGGGGGGGREEGRTFQRSFLLKNCIWKLQHFLHELFKVTSIDNVSRHECCLILVVMNERFCIWFRFDIVIINLHCSLIKNCLFY